MRRSHASVSPHNFSALSHISAITFWVVFKKSAGVYEAKFFFEELAYSPNLTLVNRVNHYLLDSKYKSVFFLSFVIFIQNCFILTSMTSFSWLFPL